MFGYVNIYKDELKIKDYNIFRAYYCGLCREIGKRSTAARFALSYDMTFLAILLSSLWDDEVQIKSSRCMAHPFGKRAYVTDDEAVGYAADMSVLLDYLKLKDDVHDDKSPAAFAGMAVLRTAAHRIEKKYTAQSGKITSLLDRLSSLEEKLCPSPDETADCFAGILSILFTPDFVADSGARRALEWLGYNLGRWIYLIDAFNDYERDKRRGSYNPLICCGRDIEELRRDMGTTLDYTLSECASAYELLNISKNDEIIRNILYIGLGARQDAVMRTCSSSDGGGDDENV